MQSAQIVIVGAGLSETQSVSNQQVKQCIMQIRPDRSTICRICLSAGKLLKENGNNVTILEARDRVGGRTCTVNDSVHGTVDLGGAYVGPIQKNVCKLAEEYGLQFTDVYDKGKSVFNFKNNWGLFEGTMLPIYNPFVLLDLNNVIRTLDTLAAQVPVHAPWKAKKAKEWDTTTVQQFIDQTCWTQVAKDTFSIISKASCLIDDLNKISLLSYLWGIHCGGGMTQMMDIKDGAQEKKFLNGSQTLSKKMAESLGDCVKLSCPVVSIKQTETKVNLTDTHGNKYTADYVILAIPPPLLSKITFDPQLPDGKTQLMKKMQLGPIIKTFMYYEEPFWRNLGLSGITLSNDGPVPATMDDTKSDGSHPAIMGIVIADQARKLMKLSQNERKEELKKFYAKTFRNDKFLEPVSYLEKSWLEEEYSQGGYNTALPPGVLTSVGSGLRQMFGRIHFAGTETATQWSGFMDGAIQSGYRASREVMQRIEGKPVTDVEEVPPMVLNKSMLEKWLPSVTGLFQATVVVLAGVVIGVVAYFVF